MLREHPNGRTIEFTDNDMIITTAHKRVLKRTGYHVQAEELEAMGFIFKDNDDGKKNTR